MQHPVIPAQRQLVASGAVGQGRRRLESEPHHPVGVRAGGQAGEHGRQSGIRIVKSQGSQGLQVCKLGRTLLHRVDHPLGLPGEVQGTRLRFSTDRPAPGRLRLLRRLVGLVSGAVGPPSVKSCGQTKDHGKDRELTRPFSENPLLLRRRLRLLPALLRFLLARLGFLLKPLGHGLLMLQSLNFRVARLIFPGPASLNVVVNLVTEIFGISREPHEGLRLIEQRTRVAQRVHRPLALPRPGTGVAFQTLGDLEVAGFFIEPTP
jgi:hypothetical protein